jgi:Tol biopolymer transport system component
MRIVILLVVLLFSSLSAQAQAVPIEQLAFDAYADDREVYRINSDGGDLVQLTDNEDIQDGNPVWSPDGTQIAFISNRADPEDAFAYGIYLMDADGQNVTQIAQGMGFEVTPNWSPDGTRIAYMWDSFDGDNSGCVLSTVNVDGTDKRDHARFDACIEYSAQWSPDGTRLALSAGNQDSWGYDIFVVDVESGAFYNLTMNQGDFTSDDAAANWSPDGEQIVFISDRDENYEVYTIDADGGSDPRRLTDDPGADIGARWEMDGTSLIFGREVDIDTTLYRLNLADGVETPITDMPTRKSCWVLSASGAQIAFTSDEDNISGGESLMVIDAAGGEPTTLLDDAALESICASSWRPVSGE